MSTYVAKALMVAIADIICSSKNVDEASRRLVAIPKVEGVAETLLLKAITDIVRSAESLEDAYRSVAQIANVEGLLLETVQFKREVTEEKKK